MRGLFLLVLLIGCSAPQCDRAQVHLWNDGKKPSPYRLSIKCQKDDQEQTIHVIRSKTKIKSGCIQ